MAESIQCPVCNWQWDGQKESCPRCEFPIARFAGLLSGKPVVYDEGVKTEFEEALERHSPSAIVAGVALGHSRCGFGFIHSEHGIFRTLIPMEVLVNEFFETRGFDFLVFVISLFLSRSRTNLTIDGITMSVPCPVTYTEEKFQLHTHWSGWPEDPVYELRQRLGIEKITIFNDAVAFALGCLLEPQAKEFPFPILCLTLGSGIGCALLQEGINGLKIVPFELVQIRKWWPVGPTGFEGDPHELAGASFFSYARHYTDWDVEETRRQFSLRITLVIQELEGKFEFNSVLLGGGRVHFVNPGEISGAISRPVGIVEQREVTFRGAAYGWAIPFLWGKRLNKVVENPEVI